MAYGCPVFFRLVILDVNAPRSEIEEEENEEYKDDMDDLDEQIFNMDDCHKGNENFF